MKHRVPFVSQIGSSHEAYGCGVAATLMLVRHAGRTDLSFSAAAKGLKVDTAPFKKWGRSGAGMGPSAYARDVTAYLSELGLPHVLIADSKKSAWSKGVLQSLASKVPVMIGVDNARETWGVGGHWIVLEPARGGQLIYLNPAIPENGDYCSPITWNKIARDWDGYAVAIVGSV